MAQPGTRGEFIDYCKRQLGAPVLEINIADEQVEDIVDDAIQFFNERHFDGIERVFLKHKVTGDEKTILEGNGASGISTTTATSTISTIIYRECSKLRFTTRSEFWNRTTDFRFLLLI